MLVRVSNDKMLVEWAKKYNLPIVKAAPAGMDNIMMEEGLMSQGDYEEWREEQQGWMSEFWQAESGSEADKEYYEIHRARLKRGAA